MHLADEVRAEIQAFASGRIGAHQLEGWLDSIAAEVHADGGPDLRALTDRSYSLLAELSYGDRTIEDARRELPKLVSIPNDAGPASSRAETTIAHGATD
jgi:hypothetical protein